MSANPIEAFKRVFSQPAYQPFFLPGARAGGGAALLVHGFPGTPAEMRPMGEALQRAGWWADAILLPGFGADIETLPQRSASEWVGAVVKELRDLRRHYERVMLVGFSLGGALALQAASLVKPDALVLYSPFWKLDNALWSILPALKHLIPTFKPFKLMKIDFNDPAARAGIAQYMPGANLDDPSVQAAIRDFAVPTNMLDQIRRTGAEAGRAASVVRVPTLVIQGTQDTLVKPEHTRMLIERFGGAAQYREVPAEHQIIAPEMACYHLVERMTIEFAAAFLPQTESQKG
jgi:carboxylesterase